MNIIEISGKPSAISPSRPARRKVLNIIIEYGILTIEYNQDQQHAISHISILLEKKHFALGFNVKISSSQGLFGTFLKIHWLSCRSVCMSHCPNASISNSAVRFTCVKVLIIPYLHALSALPLPGKDAAPNSPPEPHLQPSWGR